MKMADLTPCYCGETCEDSFKEDMLHGAIYSPMAIPPELEHLLPTDATIYPKGGIDGLRAVTWRVGCDTLRICRYCRKAVPDEQSTDL